MSDKWRRLRRLVTILMTFIGAGLVAAAWLSVGRVPGAAVVNLALLGLVLPAGFYGVFTLVGWQRTEGAKPTGFTAWCIRSHLAPVAPVMFMIFLLSLMNNINHALDRSPSGAMASARTTDDAFDAYAMRRECHVEMTKQVRAAGGDPSLSPVQSRVDRYCSCLVAGVQTSYSDTERAAFLSKPDRAREPKFRQIVQQCQGEVNRP